MKVLVTGGAGYLGTHTCVELLKEGYEVVVVDNFSNSKPEALERVMLISGKKLHHYEVDLLDYNGLSQVFEAHQIDAVIHFAGAKAVGESVQNPSKYYKNNVIGTLNLCEVMKHYHVKRMVFSSTATVYDAHNPSPLVEEMPLGAHHPYGRSKQMIENILSDYAAADETWHMAVLRYFNPIGAHESGLIGEDPCGIPNNLMPFITQVAVGKRARLEIFGNTYNTDDGTCIRDYIHVVDLALGHLKALQSLDNHRFETYNLGTGCGYSVMDVVNHFTAATGVVIPYAVVGRRDGDIAICYSNPDKAFKILKWRAKKNLQEMCRDSWRWQSLNPNGYNTVNEDR